MKLQLGATNDAAETKADHVANRITQPPKGAPSNAAGFSRVHGGNLDESFARSVAQLPTHPLPSRLRSFYEPRFGRSFADVRLATNPQAESMASRIGAGAFSVGNTIAFGANAYAPDTKSGRWLLAHELAHVSEAGPDNVVRRSPPQDAAEMANRLRNMPTDEAILEIGKIKDNSLLFAISEHLRFYSDIIEPYSGDTSTDVLPRPIGPDPHIVFLIEALESRAMEVNASYGKFVEKVVEIRKASHGIDSTDLNELNALLNLMSVSTLKRLEREVSLWPEWGKAGRMMQIMDLITARTRLSDAEESKRGRFDPKDGEDKKDQLKLHSGVYDSDDCLQFLYSSSLDILFDDETADVSAAKAAYSKGAAERKQDKGNMGAETLVRLAAELRMHGLLGPVSILRWVSSGYNGYDGYHDPSPTDVFDRLSNAGDGWYFFLCSMISYHTFVVTVRVLNGKRRYYKIQGGGSVVKSRKQLDDYFNHQYGNDEKASSRVWQVYLTPQP